MSASAQKDRFRVIGIHKVPAHLSKEEVERKVNALADKFVRIPSVQQNLLKLELLLQTKFLDDLLEKIGFAPAEPHVILVAETESLDHFTEVLKDKDVGKFLAEAKEFGFEGRASLFSVDVQIVSSPLSRGGTHYAGIYTVPHEVSVAQYGSKFQNWIESWATMQTMKKHEVDFEVWKQNNLIDNYLGELGLLRAEPFFIVRTASKEESHMIEVMKHAEARDLVSAVKQDVDMTSGTNAFCVDIVTKLDKA
ncbi:hypothetical protein B0H16DRAFT_1507864 [Mycena metata]|uniref:Uncharacterized protein n=1 Tax=Mycena metata TaxID=1033252 RepID=A0AAD7NUJ4_9AGAR|nr:hypothetical protein B0H16DRAFT_1507864 [Mycena metata]